LGSTNVVTDQNGNLVQTLDYYPFGASRISVSTSTNEARKYIGQFSDQNSGLDYLQARYYDSARGQFVNEDPVFWGEPKQQNLGDPQSLGSYSYAKDNPISNSDPTGLYAVEYSRPVQTSGYLSNFNHAFVYIVPAPGEVLPAINSNLMCINTSQPLVLGAFPAGSFPPHLTMKADDAYDYAIAQSNTSMRGVASEVISPPGGMTSSQFDAEIVSTFNSLNPDQGIYDPLGLRRTLGLSNSNNANTSLLTQSGVPQSQMNGIAYRMQNGNGQTAPGLGVSMSAPTYSQSALNSALNTLSGALRTLSKILSSNSKLSSH